MKVNNEIIVLCKAKDRLAQKQLYHQLLPYLNAVCKRYLNDLTYGNDVLQETFINLFSKLDQFDPVKGKFINWAIKITINCCLKQNNKKNKFLAFDIALPSFKMKVDPIVFSKYSNEEMMQFLKKMPENYFQVFNLFLIDGFSHKEIAELLEIDESLSRKRMSRAKAWISKRISAEQFSNFNIPARGE